MCIGRGCIKLLQAVGCVVSMPLSIINAVANNRRRTDKSRCSSQGAIKHTLYVYVTYVSTSSSFWVT